MSTVQEIKKAFHESRIAGEQKVSRGEITFDQFQFTMIGFELTLREMGEDF
jgi:hypothetical protein